MLTMRKLLVALLLLVVTLGGARADTMALMGVGSGSGGAPAYVGVGDLVPSATAYWALRCYAAANANAAQAINIRRASDNTTRDIGLTSSCDLDVSTASTFCNATTCFATEAYDQTGNGIHLLQATAAAQPQLIFNCLSSLPCLKFVRASSQVLVSASGQTPSTGVMTLVGVGERTGSTSSNSGLLGRATSFVNMLYFDGAGNKLGVGGSTRFSAAATDSAWHAAIGVVNGASSSITIEGTTTTGSGGSNTTALALEMGGAGTQFLDGQAVEGGDYDATAYNGTQISNVTTNLRSYWGF